ncbi:MAG: cupin domain-containing protein [Thermoleophilaceae bacterium]
MPPGASSFPLHVHYANQELIIVLAGRATLRTFDSERRLEPGEVVACPAGRGGAHHLDNREQEPARVLGGQHDAGAGAERVSGQRQADLLLRR